MNSLTRYPFYQPDYFAKTGLPLPDRQTMASALLPYTDAYTPTNALRAAYQQFYGFNLIDATYRQGYVVSQQSHIHIQTFEPKDITAKGTAWVLHGYLEHSGLYQPLVADIVKQGFSVVLIDLIGHGLSSGASAQIGDFNQYQSMLDDVAAYLSHIIDAQPSSPLNLPQPWLAIGQSTGAGIWMEHLLRCDKYQRTPLVRATLLLSPLVRPAISTWWQREWVIKGISQIKPTLPRIFKLNNHHPEFLRFAQKYDPLCTHVLGLYWINALTKWVHKMERYTPTDTTVWVVQGRKDVTVDWQYNLSYIKRMFDLDVLLLLDYASHQLINERDDLRRPLEAIMCRFLQAHSDNKV